MKCATSVRFTIKVNGELLPYFTPSKGLRQGDPLSPYLFLIWAQSLTSLLNHFVWVQIDRGIRVSVHAPCVNHLLFVDESLIFLNAETQSATRLNEILQIYVDCLGQAVNREKSSIFQWQYRSAPARGTQTNSQDCSGSFDHIIERSQSKVQGWSKRNMACAVREVLLKSVIQSIPTYSRSCFLLTKKACKVLMSCMAKY